MAGWQAVTTSVARKGEPGLSRGHSFGVLLVASLLMIILLQVVISAMAISVFLWLETALRPSWAAFWVGVIAGTGILSVAWFMKFRRRTTANGR